jgi:hypothetical protein
VEPGNGETGLNSNRIPYHHGISYFTPIGVQGNCRPAPDLLKTHSKDAYLNYKEISPKITEAV